MKKITDFIVEKRNYILILFLILAGICCILSSQVKINYDISSYLPSSSETRIGMDIMEEEFGQNGESVLNIMLKGLDNNDKMEVYHCLESIEGVKNVDYENTDDYNKDDYTLYMITVEGDADSAVATHVYQKIENHFNEEELATSGDVSDRNKTVLAPWIVGLAILCALLILIIMCESYTEPFLFLGTIGIAILLNKGTNILFTSVSNITDSIAAILQLALSMDYSIMLMNRYQQEKNKEKSKEKAMKNALYNAFLSISSSSVTTIVGLIALVFMSFTIGRDLGFVLAKGVLFSLLSIFTCLPALILLCDKWITKTKKKSPVIKLDFLGKMAYKGRYISIFLFILVFGLSYALKGNLGILYTDSETDEIAKIFPMNNQVAIIYKNEEENHLAEYCKTLEENHKVDTVLCYGNTINEKLTFNKLKSRLDDLGSEADIDTYLLKIVYYTYYNKEINNKMSFEEFTHFIKNEVYQNDDIGNSLDNDTRKNIDKLDYFTNTKAIHTKRNAKEIADILGIEEDKVKDILIYYHSKNTNTKLSIKEFVEFITNYVLKQEKYASRIDSKTRSSLKQISTFTNKTTLQKKMTSKEMAALFGMDEEIVHSLYLYYVSVNEVNTKLSIAEFGSFVKQFVLTNDAYKNQINATTRKNIDTLIAFSNKDTITKDMNTKELANTFGLKEDVVQGILLLNYSTKDNGTQLTMKEFVNSVLLIKNTTSFLDQVDTSLFETLSKNEMIMNNSTKYTATLMAQDLGLKASDLYSLYAIIDFANGNTNSWKMSPNAFVTFLLANSTNETISNGLTSETKENLKLLQMVMTSTIQNTKYSYKKMATLIGVNESTLKNIYSLYVISTSPVTMTPQTFVTFLLQHQKDSLLANHLNNNTIQELTLLNKVMDGVINNKVYTYKDLSNLLGMDKNSLSLLYSLYDSTKKNFSISLKETVHFILNDVMHNKDYSSQFDTNSRNKLNTVNEIMNGTEQNTKFSNGEMYQILSTFANDLDKNLIELLYIYYDSENNYNSSWTLTIEEFVNYLNEDILKDARFTDFIAEDVRQNILDSNDLIHDAKELLVGENYSRVVINTKFDAESEETFQFISSLQSDIGEDVDYYVIGNSPMAYEMSKTFEGELNFITILTMVFIFIVVAVTFKSLTISFILVLLIQCAVYLTMGLLSFGGGTVYFIALLIVQSILMGATIDYAILYTSYYLESRKTMNVEKSIINSYNKSIHTILTSASILIIATLIIGHLATAIAAKICKTLSQGTLCAALLILILLPAVLGACDRLIVKNKNTRNKKNA